MKVRVASHQPAFLPWPGFWHKFVSSDVFVLSAGVQWTDDSFLQRCRLGGHWVSLPVRKASPLDKATIGADEKRLASVLATITQAIGSKRYPYGRRLTEVPYTLERMAKPGASLVDLNITLIAAIGRILSPRTKLILNTQPPDPALSTTQRLRERVGWSVPEATEYLAGQGALDYLEPAEFGLPVRVQDISRFDPEQSIIDVIASVPWPTQWLLDNGGWGPYLPTGEQHSA